MLIRRSTPRRRLVVLVGVAALALAACGDDDDAGPAEPDPTVSAGDDTSTERTSDAATTDPAVSDPTTSDPATSDPATSDPATSDPATTGDVDGAADWRTQFEALCETARTSGQALEEPETMGEFKEIINSLIDTGDTLFEDAAELTPPAELEEGFSDLSSAWDDQRGRLEALTERIDSDYDDDQVLADVPDAEGQELVGDALDQSALTEAAAALDVSCFTG